MSGGTDPGTARERALFAQAVGDFELDVWVRRRELFLRHLALNVSHATPLLDVVVSQEGLDLTRMLMAIEPPPSWPRVGLRRRGFMGPPLVGRAPLFSVRGFRRRHMWAGVVTLLAGGGSDLVGVRIADNGLEITASVGDLCCETYAGRARLLVPGRIPDTVASRLAGRPIDDLVSHRWLDGTGWPIVEVGAGSAGTTVVTIETGSAVWRMAEQGSIHA